METIPISVEQQTALTVFLGEWAVYIVILLIVVVFRDSIQNVVAGLMVFWGNDLNDDDVVILDGQPARIARAGKLKTTFYLYTIDAGRNFVNGTVKHIENIKLAEHSIEKPLPLLSDLLVVKYSDKSLKE